MRASNPFAQFTLLEWLVGVALGLATLPALAAALLASAVLVGLFVGLSVHNSTIWSLVCVPSALPSILLFAGWRSLSVGRPRLALVLSVLIFGALWGLYELLNRMPS